ncbi:MAG: cell division protein FtsZ [bacterium]|nr:cell division protein FtsZ [bacterium]
MIRKTKIKVIGVGGSGGNALNRMNKAKIGNIELVALNTDFQDLKKIKADFKIQIGEKTTRGLGTGMDSSLGRKAALESKEKIEKVLAGSDMVFITCGMGGGTGTGASPIVAELAKKAGILTIGIVTTPFSFEGIQRERNAQQGISELKNKVDSLVVINNDNLLAMIDKQTSLLEAFWICDDVLRQAVKGISELISQRGMVNVDFADVKTILKNSGCALFGIGKARGENRVAEAVARAISSPLTETRIEKASGVLFNVAGKNLSLFEIKDIANLIKSKIDSRAKIIFGAKEDGKIVDDSIELTLLVTGFNN